MSTAGMCVQCAEPQQYGAMKALILFRNYRVQLPVKTCPKSAAHHYIIKCFAHAKDSNQQIETLT